MVLLTKIPVSPDHPRTEREFLLKLRNFRVCLFLAQRKSRYKKVQARSLIGGQYQSPQKGRGLEYAETRAYEPGDDVRHIDWRVTARTERPHTKLFREERERPLMILLVLNRSMFFGTRQRLNQLKPSGLLHWLDGRRFTGVTVLAACVWEMEVTWNSSRKDPASTSCSSCISGQHSTISCWNRLWDRIGVSTRRM